MIDLNGNLIIMYLFFSILESCWNHFSYVMTLKIA